MGRERIDKRTLFRVGDLLTKRNLKLACAESMTAGFLSSTFALEVNSGHYYLGSIACYDDQLKQNLLDVSPTLLAEHTAESKEVTLAMLQGLQTLIPQADISITITGLAFESPNPDQWRPVGRVYYAFHYKDKQYVFEKQFKGNAGQIIIATCNSIFSDLHDLLSSENTN